MREADAGLQVLVLAHNKLSGSIPPELGNLSNLHMLNLEDNELSGCLSRIFQRLMPQPISVSTPTSAGALNERKERGTSPRGLVRSERTRMRMRTTRR